MDGWTGWAKVILAGKRAIVSGKRKAPTRFLLTRMFRHAGAVSDIPHIGVQGRLPIRVRPALFATARSQDR
jgi:hypothetical protein